MTVFTAPLQYKKNIRLSSVWFVLGQNIKEHKVTKVEACRLVSERQSFTEIRADAAATDFRTVTGTARTSTCRAISLAPSLKAFSGTEIHEGITGK